MNWEKKYSDVVQWLRTGNGCNFGLRDDNTGELTVPTSAKPVLIDGELASPEAVDPVQHEYCGTFRPPCAPTFADHYEHYGCSPERAWRDGIFDLLSYRTIKK